MQQLDVCYFISMSRISYPLCDLPVFPFIFVFRAPIRTLLSLWWPVETSVKSFGRSVWNTTHFSVYLTNHNPNPKLSSSPEALPSDTGIQFWHYRHVSSLLLVYWKKKNLQVICTMKHKYFRLVIVKCFNSKLCLLVEGPRSSLWSTSGKMEQRERHTRGVCFHTQYAHCLSGRHVVYLTNSL